MTTRAACSPPDASAGAAPGDEAAPRTAELALSLPVAGTFTYLVPSEIADLVTRGSVVAAPFAGQMVTGFVVRLGGELTIERERLKPIRKVLLAGQAISEETFRLAEAVADYYLVEPGEVLRAAAPPLLDQRLLASLTALGRSRLAEAGMDATAPGGAGERSDRGDRLSAADLALLEALAAAPAMTPAALERSTGVRTARARLTRLEALGLVRRGHEVKAKTRPRREVWLELCAEADTERRRAALGRAPKALALLARLERESGGTAELRALARELGVGPAQVEKLVAAGLIRSREVLVDRDLARSGTMARAAGRLGEARLTPAQAKALAEVGRALAGGRFQCFLLHGITGSGKTLVYAGAIAAALERGRSALFLVPEIALTPLLVAELRSRFGDQVAMLHSGLGEGERVDAWRRLQQGRARVAFGARSAVFAPLRDLGVVIVDEEHDHSYKQDERPRYHARDVAVLRAKLAGVPVVLGSATPSLESYANARAGRYRLLTLPERAGLGRLPAVEVIDLREEYAREGKQVLLSRPLLKALEERLARGEQALLLINRRGYASFLLCRECGSRPDCPHCSVSLTFHKRDDRLRCHHCDHEQRAPRACASCQGTFLNLVGHGTEKVETAVRHAFPRARVARLDRDVARDRGQVPAILGRCLRGEIDVLVGTQMVAKGHDFPNVTLVGVISVDAMLALPDFRSAERAFALLTQVAGRAGRGDRPGSVLLQTYYPDNEAVKLACLQDYPAFYERESRLRRLLAYPPSSHLVQFLARDRDRDRAMKDAQEVKAALLRHRLPAVTLVGPALAPLERVKDLWRCQLLLRAPSRRELRATLKGALAELTALTARLAVEVDIDPQDLL